MVQLNTPWIFIRGLTRGNGHWADFPEKFHEQNPEAEFELLEISGNGTCFKELTPLNPEVVIAELRNKSQILLKSRSVNICGISLGGMIALKWAELYPDEVNSVVVVNSSLSQFSRFFERLKPKNYFQVFRAAMTSSHKNREEIILSIISNNVAQRLIYVDKFSKFSKEFPFRFTNLIRQLILANRIVISFPVTVPIKVICSAKDRLVNHKCSLALGEAMKTEVIIHPSAGHDIPLDDSKWLTQTLLVAAPKKI